MPKIVLTAVQHLIDGLKLDVEKLRPATTVTCKYLYSSTISSLSPYIFKGAEEQVLPKIMILDLAGLLVKHQ